MLVDGDELETTPVAVVRGATPVTCPRMNLGRLKTASIGCGIERKYATNRRHNSTHI